MKGNNSKYFAYAGTLAALVAIVLLTYLLMPKSDDETGGPTGGTLTGNGTGDTRTGTSDNTTANPDDNTRHPNGKDGQDTATNVKDLRYYVSGKVIDEAGNPIPSASVSVHLSLPGHFNESRRIKETVTDESGAFLISHLPEKDLLITCDKDEYYFSVPELQRTGWTQRFKKIFYVEGRSAADGIELVMFPGETISGKTLDENGLPVFPARITLGQWHHSERSAEVDENGEFTLKGLAPGAYALKGEAAGYVSAHIPGVASGTQDVVLKFKRGCIVEGVVIYAASGLPAPNAEVTTWGTYADRNTVMADEAGRFSTAVEPDSRVNIVARLDNLISSSIPPISSSAEKPVDNIVLKLREGSSISGIVLEEGAEKPVQGVTIRAPSTAMTWLETTSSEDGTFNLAGLNPGAKTLQVLSDEYQAANLQDLTIRLEEGESATGIKIYVKRPAVIRGKVVNQENDPVEKAMVSLSDPNFFGSRWADSVLTDKEGRFSLRRSEYGYGRRGILVTHDEYAHKFVELGDLESGAAKEITIILDSGGAVSGTVRDSTGDPVTGASVALLIKQGSRTPMPFEVKSVNTDDTGAYTIAGVARGKYNVKASIGVRSSESEEFVMAENETRSGVDLVIGVGGSISGRLTDDSGEPLANIRVTAAASGQYPSTTSKDDGTYSIDNLAEGTTYVVTVQIWYGVSIQFDHVEPRKVTASADNIDFVLNRIKTGSVTGNVYRASDGAPVTKFYLTLLPHRVKNGTFQPGGAIAYWNRKFESPDGSFTCENVRTGNYTIKIAAPDLPEHSTEPFEVFADAATNRVITVGGGGSVSGKVIDGKGQPVSNATVSVFDNRTADWTERNAPDLINSTQTDATGGFLLQNVTPGSVKLRASHPEYADGQTANIEVTEGETKSGVEITLKKGTLIYGHVLDADGKPKTHVDLTRFGSGSTPYMTAKTDGNGRYEFSNVLDGFHTITISRMSCSRTFQVNGEDEIEINFDLSTASSFTGSVFVTGSKPEGAMFYVFLQDAASKGRYYSARKSAKVDESGTFSFEGILPGKYNVTVAGYGRAEGGGAVSYEIETSPREIVLEITPEQDVVEDITITRMVPKQNNPGENR